MTIKIDAPKGYEIHWQSHGDHASGFYMDGPCRIVRESDWRRIWAVVKAADEYPDHYDLVDAVIALRKHLAKDKP